MIPSADRLLDEQGLRNLPGPAWLIEGRIPARGLVLLYSAPGAGKSIIAASLLGAVVAEREWFGAPISKGGPAVCAPVEDLPGSRSRWLAWRCSEGITDRTRLPLFTWPHELNLFTGTGFTALSREADRVKPRIITIDTWAWATAGADENTARDTGISLARIDLLRRETDATVCVLHHATKDGSGERGSSALRAAMDTVISLTRADGTVVVECEKQRNGTRFPPLRLRLDPAALVFRTAGASLPPTSGSEQAKVLEALRVLCSKSVEGATVKEWHRRATEIEGVKRRTFYDAIRRLQDRGAVCQTTGETDPLAPLKLTPF